MQRRLDDLIRFYSALDQLERRVGGCRLLASCDGRSGWPNRGVYFFMEVGERRTDSGEGMRIVRVGTHALTSSSRTTLWNRLSQHKGQTASGGGNHRGSIFRLLVGSTLLKTSGAACPTWGVKNSAPHDVRVFEQPFEQEVSRIIGAMPFLWLGIDDAPGTASMRGYVERNAIALLSNGIPESPPAFEATVGVNRQLNQAVHRLPLPSGASITPEVWRRIYWTMVLSPARMIAKRDRSTLNTIVQWRSCETRAPIACALFVDAINRAPRTNAVESRSDRISKSPSRDWAYCTRRNPTRLAGRTLFRRGGGRVIEGREMWRAK